MRALASIQEIRSINRIKDADRIEVAEILGWHVVVQKGEFKTGERVIYVETDSVLPERPEFEFLRQCCYIEKNGFKGFYIKTRKLKGIISQGIAFPLSVLAIALDGYCPENIEVGVDVTAFLDILKYDPPLPTSFNGMAKGNFPSWIPKTDEKRIQSTKGVLERNRGKLFYATEKIDGCLEGDTQLITPDGNFSIRDLCETQYTGLVLSHDFREGDLFDRVIYTSINDSNGYDWYEITLENGIKIVATGNHKFYMPDLRCFRESVNLKDGDMLEVRQNGG